MPGFHPRLRPLPGFSRSSAPAHGAGMRFPVRHAVMGGGRQATVSRFGKGVRANTPQPTPRRLEMHVPGQQRREFQFIGKRCDPQAILAHSDAQERLGGDHITCRILTRRKHPSSIGRSRQLYCRGDKPRPADTLKCDHVSKLKFCRIKMHQETIYKMRSSDHNRYANAFLTSTSPLIKLV